MSAIFPKKMQCSCCGAAFDTRVLGSTNRFGHMDLDTRPPMMMRATMPFWIHTCPNCGFVNGEQDGDYSELLDYVKSEEYVSCEGNAFSDALGAGFYRRGLILIRLNQLYDAFFAFLRAAWCFDDRQDSDNAVICRSRCISLADRIDAPEADFVVLKADVYRRAGRFHELPKELLGTECDNDILGRLMKAEIDLALAGDTACHNVGEFMESC